MHCIFHFADWTLDAENGSLTAKGEDVPIEPKQLSLLLYLALNQERRISYRELLAAVWTGESVEQASVHNAIRGLRVALKQKPGSHWPISNKRLAGYKLDVLVTRELTSRPRPSEENRLLWRYYAAHALPGRESEEAAITADEMLRAEMLRFG